MSNEAQPNRSNGWPIAATILGLALIALVAYSGKSVIDIPGKVFDKLHELFTGTNVINSTIWTSTKTLTKKSKLVVLQAEIKISIQRISEKSGIIDFIPTGTTEVWLEADHNKVQYFVPLTGISTNSFRYDKSNNKLLITIPEPKADEDIIELQQAPELRTKVGLLRLDKRSGESLRQQCMQEMRSAVIKESKSEVNLNQARQNASIEIQKLLQPALQTVPGATVEVLFQ